MSWSKHLHDETEKIMGEVTAKEIERMIMDAAQEMASYCKKKGYPKRLAHAAARLILASPLNKRGEAFTAEQQAQWDSVLKSESEEVARAHNTHRSHPDDD